MEPRPNRLRALSHPRQAPVSFPPRLKHLGVNSAAVITNENAEALDCILELDFDAVRAGVPKCIYQRFTTDPVNFIADDRMQRLRPAFHDDAKITFRLDRELLSNQGECMFEIARATMGCAQSSYSVPAFFDNLPH